MEFSRLYVKNFLTISTASIELANKGLHLIQGQNDDDSSAASNGAGKSSLVDAICWALFGRTARDVKGDAVVNRTAKKECYVTLIMRNGDAIYTVTRYRKHSTGKNTLHLSVATDTTPSVDLSKGTDAETQKEVERVLGCSYEVFMAAVYSGQEVMPDLPRMTDKALKTLIEESAGMARIERAYGIARERMQATTKAIMLTDNARGFALSAHTTASANLAQELASEAKWDADRFSGIDDIETAIKAAEGSIAKVSLDVTAAEPARTAATLRVGVIQAQLAGFRAQQEAAADARREHQRLDRLIDRTGLAAAKSNRDMAIRALDNAEEEMKAPCSECGKPHTPEELETFKKHLAERVAKAHERLNDKTIEVGTAARAAVHAKLEADRLEADLPDVSQLHAELVALKVPVQAYEDAKGLLESYKTNRDGLVRELTDFKAMVNPHSAGVARFMKQVQEQDKKLIDLQEDRNRHEKQLAIDEAVVKLFGPAGVRAQILDTVTPYLNDRTADYLSVLSDGNLHATWTTLTRSAAGDLKEKFSIDVSNDKGSDSFLGLSGGEKRKVRLATALALQDLVASRATQPIGLWIGDEIDDALDPAGLERLMTILERRARERGTVVVISHSDLRDWIDEVTIVRKSGGSSVVEGSLCV
jgi:DNA repair exonuclease SbcCD ATPase subunit